jgi:hypothetical protein
MNNKDSDLQLLSDVYSDSINLINLAKEIDSIAFLSHLAKAKA